MSAKLLEFHGLPFNTRGVTYLLMTEGKNNTFTCEMKLDNTEDPEHKLIGIIFGAQQSMITRKVNKNTTMTRRLL